jgi:diguanylate cyclase (GGDEF)-like protein/PAS domain S-box-containing protein
MFVAPHGQGTSHNWRPPMNRTSPQEKRRFRIEWIALAAMLSIIGASSVWSSLSERANGIAIQSDRLQNQAHLVDENLLRQLEGANKALVSVRDDLRQLDPAINGMLATDKLTSLTNAMPGVSTMLLLDVDGKVVGTSRGELLGIDFSERAYFTVPRQNPDPDVLYVSPPFRSSRGTLVIVVSRVLTNRAGGFAGVVTAALDPDYFKIALQSVLYAPDMRATLMAADGNVFLDVPVGQKPLDLDLANADAAFNRQKRSGAPASLIVGKVFGAAEDRMLALRSVDRADLRMNAPMVIAISRDLSVVSLPWREKAIQLGSVFASLALGLGLALFFNHRRRVEQGEAAAAVAMERRAGAERVELALSGANLGLWDLHVQTGQVVVNARERALLGFADDDELPQGDGWRSLIHPGDLAAVDAAILPHLRGEAASYYCELRMAHKDGNWIWLSSRAMIVERDADGAPLRIIGTHLDISERKRADAALAKAAQSLRDSEEQLRQVTDNVPALIARFDTEERFLFANLAYYDWLHVEPSTLIGRTLRDVYGEKSYARSARYMRAAMAGEKTVYERKMTTLKGLRNIEVTLIPELGADGSVKGLYSLINDITARARSEERLTLALEGSSHALFDWDIANDRMFQSAQAAVMRGYLAEETTTTGAEVRAGVHPDDLKHVMAQIFAVLKGAVPLYRSEFRLSHRSGDWIWVRAIGRVVDRDGTGRAQRVAGTYSDISNEKAAEGKLRRLAELDGLTGLPNRTLFNHRLEEAIARANAGKPMALLFLDVDHFKTVNDTHGHESGDEVLKVCAARMQSVVRKSDTVSRLAGDEFTIILEDISDLRDAERVARKLVETLRRPIALSTRSLAITVSIGIALHVRGEDDPAALLRVADAALYEAKHRGRDGYFCGTPTSGLVKADVAAELPAR